HETRRCLLNVVGTTIWASAVPETDALVTALARLGRGRVAPPGRSELLADEWAAVVTGFCAHYDDYDDTHLETVIHPGAPTLAALWPVALTTEVPGELALAAFALGVEAQLRVGLAISPAHYDAGWHITGTCGAFGAAVAAGLASGMEP